MYHSAIELQAIADAHLEDLRNERHRTAATRSTPGILAGMRRNVGLALIAAGEAIADRRSPRPSIASRTPSAASTSRLVS